jgi:hypothetical protein
VPHDWAGRPAREKENIVKLRLTSFLAVGAAFAFSALPTMAQTNPTIRSSGQTLGAIPVASQGGLGATSPDGAGRNLGLGNLRYHSGGSVQTGTHNTYAIYWNPWGSTDNSTYQSTINQYFSDVASDSGKTTNVYYSDTQYYQTIGGTTTHITYSEHFAGSAVDTTTPTSSGCTDTSGGTLGCVTDAQLQTEIETVRAQKGWPTGPTNEYFVFLGKGVSDCASDGSCFGSTWCAYHGSYSVSGKTVIYANMPYTGQVGSACGSKQSPNANQDADSTINVTSHEANESITDYLGNAWYDYAGYENGDKCAWTFGSYQGTPGAEYNQTINGHHYYLQGEWSNAHSKCVWSNT